MNHSTTDGNKTSSGEANKAAQGITSEDQSTKSLSSSKKKEDDYLLGKTIAGRYIILDLIGAGGFGSVYKARQISLNKIIALKILRSEYVEDKKIAARFQHEAMIASNITNLHIAASFDHGICDETKVVFIAMEYVPGPSLKEVIKGEQKPTVDRCLNILIQLCDGISAAHAKSVLHRDIKPSNIILTNVDGNADFVKITDFGIAKVLNESEELKKLTKTETESFLGTCQYMGPEQFQSGYKGDYRSDVYSIGCVLFELLTGQPPFNGGSLPATAHMHATAKVPDLVLDSVDPVIKQRLSIIVSKALEKEPSARYQSVNDLRADLEKVQLRLEQLKLRKTNAITLTLERCWLFLCQLVRSTIERLFSIPIGRRGATAGATLLLSSLILLTIATAVWVFLFNPFSNLAMVDKELPLKPLIDASINTPDSKKGESIWKKVETSSIRWTPILERALDEFIKLGDLCKKTGNFEEARWWYYRSELVIGWLKIEKSILAITNSNSYAESCLQSNAAYSPNQVQFEQVKSLVKKYGNSITPQIFRNEGLIFAANAATARDAAQGALGLLYELKPKGDPDNNERAQALLAQGLLAESLSVLGDMDGAQKNYDKFYEMVPTVNLYSQLDKAQSTFLLASAGRFYLQRKQNFKAQEMLGRLQSALTEFGSPARYNLAGVYNDLGLMKEAMGKPGEAEAFFQQSYTLLVASPQCSNKDKSLILKNLASAAFKSRDYKNALKSELKAVTNLDI